MYIVAIAWIYVVFMMSITEQTATAAVMTFLLYGVIPLSIVLYLMGTPQRKRNRQRAEQRKRMLVEKDAALQVNAESDEPKADSTQLATPKSRENPTQKL
ncbi:hypothetical protein QN360_15655 [Glaciimonas sp. CA11.2]|uniref:hypothetical protein n=1 Tax=unclassified Glaciimonas TaxID=2644401 RepID=UPI002AB4526D|nr:MULTISPECIES: hypothetical protein [unclassified Glaciimonas]MDY7547935.1 hypothetical protein [Glaciimonas sp. CA11.2]MEB0010107.1 hypothetical protein [Glaciimonas sp. Cout2]MEB0081778.1 hypothetical protein [Glaciimonas sp. Gout2]MEB0164330.1 hypothetical protein [Glaciimonas sp. CA11.2]